MPFDAAFPAPQICKEFIKHNMREISAFALIISENMAIYYLTYLLKKIL